jgi:hypothetical protein
MPANRRQDARAPSELLVAVEQNRYWAIVDQLNLHHSLKFSSRNFIDNGTRLPHKKIIERFGDLRRCRVDP